jgi:hypothetical protein
MDRIDKEEPTLQKFNTDISPAILAKLRMENAEPMFI